MIPCKKIKKTYINNLIIHNLLFYIRLLLIGILNLPGSFFNLFFCSLPKAVKATQKE